jgi:hypothetical protein
MNVPIGRESFTLRSWIDSVGGSDLRRTLRFGQDCSSGSRNASRSLNRPSLLLTRPNRLGRELVHRQRGRSRDSVTCRGDRSAACSDALGDAPRVDRRHRSRRGIPCDLASDIQRRAIAEVTRSRERLTRPNSDGRRRRRHGDRCKRGITHGQCRMTYHA